MQLYFKALQVERTDYEQRCIECVTSNNQNCIPAFIEMKCPRIQFLLVLHVAVVMTNPTTIVFFSFLRFAAKCRYFLQ